MSSDPKDKPVENAEQPPKVVVPETGEVKPVSELTPEQQMELYESDLKENDWGHQPC